MILIQVKHLLCLFSLIIITLALRKKAFVLGSVLFALYIGVFFAINEYILSGCSHKLARKPALIPHYCENGWFSSSYNIAKVMAVIWVFTPVLYIIFGPRLVMRKSSRKK